MGHTYVAVAFNRHKRIYDLTVAGSILAYLALFILAGSTFYPEAAPETILIRALSTAAFGLLHVILSIGPLARINSRFLPLLYNRRHLGVMMAILATGHAIISLLQFHGFGDLNPILSVLVGDGSYVSLSDFPFQPFGLLAWLILLVMAATSHDFWLNQFSAPVWKRLHMLVYLAYVFLVVHVLFGTTQDAESWMPTLVTAAGAIWVVGVHLVAGFGRGAGAIGEAPAGGGTRGEGAFVDVAHIDDIPDEKGLSVQISGEQVAIFRHDGQFVAVSGVCQHQNGPLAEGRIIDGLITCPWHGYQYCPHSGKSPPPFMESIPVFETRVSGSRLQISRLPKKESEFPSNLPEGE